MFSPGPAAGALGQHVASSILVPLPGREDCMWEGVEVLEGALSCQYPRFLRVPDFSEAGLPGGLRLDYLRKDGAKLPVRARLLTTSLSEPRDAWRPSRDPAEVRGLAAQRGTVGGAVTGTGVRWPDTPSSTPGRQGRCWAMASLEDNMSG